MPSSGDGDELDGGFEAAPTTATSSGRFESGIDDGLGDEACAGAAPCSPIRAQFAEVVALAGNKRDMKLKLHLEDHVSLVKFDAPSGSIDLLSAARRATRTLANELREKLNAGPDGAGS